MRKARHILSKDWKDSRAEIDRIIKEQRIEPDRFRILDIHEDWKGIEDKVYQTFCQLDHPTSKPTYLWESFKQETVSLTKEKPWLYLDQLVDQNERVWFFDGGEKKSWFFEGFIKEIVTVIDESTYAIDEIYIASKKYEWLI
ncbi:MAG: hypothetical protein J7527_09430, partial [Chitinophagaceae bacterium]|nr:hypothetical protein [Chitinophagaceae bacterium]